MNQASRPPAHLEGLTEPETALYDQMLGRVVRDGTDYWTALRGLAAAPADKYALAQALGATVEARAYATEARIAITESFHTDQGKLTTTETPIEDLKAGDRYVGDDGRSICEVIGEAASHQRGWVYVRQLGVDPTARHPDGSLAAEGFLAFPPGTPMRRVHQASTVGNPASGPPPPCLAQQGTPPRPAESTPATLRVAHRPPGAATTNLHPAGRGRGPPTGCSFTRPTAGANPVILAAPLEH